MQVCAATLPSMDLHPTSCLHPAANDKGATSSITVPIARRPACTATAGSCLTVFPASGPTDTTTFEATVAGFVADGTLLYSFGAELEGANNVTYKTEESPQYTIRDWMLPPGKHTIFVCAQGG